MTRLLWGGGNFRVNPYFDIREPIFPVWSSLTPCLLEGFVHPSARRGRPVTPLASQLQIDPSALQDYGKRRMTRSTHFNAVLQHLGFHRVQPDNQAPIVAWLTERALEHDKPTLLFHMICERLKQQQRIRPDVTTVERWVVTARMQAHHESLH
jgi:hypothetical protein